MIDDALTWAGWTLGSPVVSHEALTGGMTSTMIALRHRSGENTVLRLMTEEPWRTHGVELTARERVAQRVLADTEVPAPTSLAVDADVAGAAAHLMSRLPGAPRQVIDDAAVREMARLLGAIHAVRPEEPFRTFQSWAWEAKWVVPSWSRHPGSWHQAFEALAGTAPDYAPTFLHRDFSHRNLLWDDGSITGVVDWVETSTGPAGLDAAHAATNLAVAFGNGPAETFLQHWSETSGTPIERHWLVMDAVGFLPPPGRPPMFGEPAQLDRLDAWLHLVVGGGLS